MIVVSPGSVIGGRRSVGSLEIGGRMFGRTPYICCGRNCKAATGKIQGWRKRIGKVMVWKWAGVLKNKEKKKVNNDCRSVYP
jgi:hypothetical protein